VQGVNEMKWNEMKWNRDRDSSKPEPGDKKCQEELVFKESTYFNQKWLIKMYKLIENFRKDIYILLWPMLTISPEFSFLVNFSSLIHSQFFHNPTLLSSSGLLSQCSQYIYINLRKTINTNNKPKQPKLTTINQQSSSWRGVNLF
jgi:hypothetical protein